MYPSIFFSLPSALLAGILWLKMHYSYSIPIVFSFASSVASASNALASNASNTSVDLSWHPPQSNNITDLSSVINGTGVWNFVFNSSTTPADLPYCKLPS